MQCFFLFLCYFIKCHGTEITWKDCESLVNGNLSENQWRLEIWSFLKYLALSKISGSFFSLAWRQESDWGEGISRHLVMPEIDFPTNPVEQGLQSDLFS